VDLINGALGVGGAFLLTWLGAVVDNAVGYGMRRTRTMLVRVYGWTDVASMSRSLLQWTSFPRPALGLFSSRAFCLPCIADAIGVVRLCLRLPNDAKVSVKLIECLLLRICGSVDQPT
jgi:hypothetical protein